MKMYRSAFLMVSIVFVSISTSAQTTSGTSGVKVDKKSILALPPCWQIQQESSVGTVCRTNISTWERVFVNGLLGWKDQKGITWFDYTQRDVTHSVANNFCRSLGARLPSKEDFESAESHEIRRVFRDIVKPGLKLWSSSFTSKNKNRVYFFNGDGKIDTQRRELSDSWYSVRCVSANE